MTTMNADVLIWGPIGNWYQLGKPAGTRMLRQQRWRDLPDSELEDAINWVIQEQMNAGGDIIQGPNWPRLVCIYTGTAYSRPGVTWKIGKNIGGHSTLFHYMIVSDEKIETKEQAEQLVWEALEGGDNASSAEVQS